MEEDNLQSLLVHWAKAEPQRCRQLEPDNFEVQYFGHWIPVNDQPASHGTIIAAALAGCQENSIYCEVEFTPRYEDTPHTIEVGCIPRVFRYREGEDVISLLPVLLLTEYLERLENRPPAWIERLKQ